MKRYLFFIFCIALGFSMYGQAIPALRIEGVFIDQTTLQPIPYHPFSVHIADSAGTTVYHQMWNTANELGYYSYDLPGVPYPNNSIVTIAVFNCEGSNITRQFNYPAVYTYYSGQDFNICPIAPACQAAWNSWEYLPVNLGVQFQNKSLLGATSWTWDFGDGDTSQMQSALHIYPSIGSYPVCLTVTGLQGCVSTFCDTVRVGATGIGQSSVSLHYGQLSPGVMGFTAIPQGAPKASRFLFYVGHGIGNYSLSQTMPYLYAYGSNYTPWVLAEFTNDSIAIGYLTNLPTGTCQSDFYTLPDPSGQYSLLIVNNSYGNQLTYQWSFGDGDSSTAQYPTHTYAGSGTYQLCLTVTDSGALCSRIYCDSIQVTNKVNAPFTIHAVSPLTTATAPEVSSIQGLTFFPNPAHERITLGLSIAAPSEVNVEFFNLQGQMLQSNRLGKLAAGQHEASMDVSNLPEGMYLARVVVGGKVETRKLIVTH